MEAYAVVETGGKQYRVEKDDVLAIELVEGAKVVAFKKKRLKGYHKKIGHRQELLRVKVTSIG